MIYPIFSNLVYPTSKKFQHKILYLCYFLSQYIGIVKGILIPQENNIPDLTTGK